MKDKTARLFLTDLCTLLKEKAYAAKSYQSSEATPENREFATGQLMAYHDIVSLILQQADAFGIEPEDLEMHDINPDTDLL